jgi:hypothetical protein
MWNIYVSVLNVRNLMLHLAGYLRFSSVSPDLCRNKTFKQTMGFLCIHCIWSFSPPVAKHDENSCHGLLVCDTVYWCGRIPKFRRTYCLHLQDDETPWCPGTSLHVVTDQKTAIECSLFIRHCMTYTVETASLNNLRVNQPSLSSSLV